MEERPEPVLLIAGSGWRLTVNETDEILRRLRARGTVAPARDAVTEIEQALEATGNKFADLDPGCLDEVLIVMQEWRAEGNTKRWRGELRRVAQWLVVESRKPSVERWMSFHRSHPT